MLKLPQNLSKEGRESHHAPPTQSSPKIEAARNARAVASISSYTPWNSEVSPLCDCPALLHYIEQPLKLWSKYYQRAAVVLRFPAQLSPTCLPILCAPLHGQSQFERTLYWFIATAEHLWKLLVYCAETINRHGSQLSERVPSLYSHPYSFMRWKTPNVIIYFPDIPKFLVPEIYI